MTRLGLVVSVDDFGTGFSSLAYLSDLAVGELKIDQALTKRLASADDHKGRAVVRATIDLGHSLGMRVVAEGVEDAETYASLASLGCDLAQGHVHVQATPSGKAEFRAGERRCQIQLAGADNAPDQTSRRSIIAMSDVLAGSCQDKWRESDARCTHTRPLVL